MLEFDIGKVYTFDTSAPALLGAQIKNAKVLAFVDYDTAKLFDTIDLKWRAIFPLLPTGTPDAPDLTTYYLLLSESGEKIVLAEPWIQGSTITEVGFIQFQVTFPKASLDDIEKVRASILALGFTEFNIKRL